MLKQLSMIDVFVASPSDLEEEREALGEVVDDLNREWANREGLHIRLLRWETHAIPGIGEDAQAQINEQIGDDYEIFVGLLWTRFGTATQHAGSGTEEEFNRAYARHAADGSSVRVMVYFKDAPPESMDAIDPEQLAKVREFRVRIGEAGVLHWKFKDTTDFRRDVRLHLTRCANEIRSKERAGSQQPDTAPQPVTEDAEVADNTDEDVGFFDLCEDSLASIAESCAHMQILGEALGTLGSCVEQTTNEMNALSVEDAPHTYVRDQKRLSNTCAGALEVFARVAEAEGPLILSLLTGGLDKSIQAVSLISETVDLGAGDDTLDVVEMADELVDLTAKMLSSAEAMREFASNMAGLPRLTTKFNRARRRAVASVNTFADDVMSACHRVNECQTFLMEMGIGEATPDH